MKVLVLVEDYPSEESKILMYVHVRNLYYKRSGIDVTVLSFRSSSNYSINGINVITLSEYKKNQDKYSDAILILHAPNLKHHFMFLKKYEKNFKNLCFFFHGHEVLYCSKVYPKPYRYVKDSNLIKKIIRNIYDVLKLYVWRKYYTKLTYKSHFVFVSNWMYEEFLKWTKINPEKIKNRYSITYNCVGELFEKEIYNYKKEKKYDFITIRPNLDGSKYSIDIVNELAKINPDFTFLVIGKGKFFEYNKKSSNLIWLNRVLNHKEIVEYLNDSKCALMPTRTDAQGLMMCEMATFGIPVITSDIPVCHEIFDEFKNVKLINNNDDSKKLDIEFKELIKNLPYEKNGKYFNSNTSQKEVEIFKEILNGNNGKQN